MPSDTTKQVLIRLPVRLLKRLDADARAANRSRTATVARLLEESLRRKREQQQGASA